MTDKQMTDLICRAIAQIVCAKLNTIAITWTEIEKIYASGERPDINSAIDYILYGDTEEKNF